MNDAWRYTGGYPISPVTYTTTTNDLAARIRAHREDQQAKVNRTWPRRGTTNRALSEWVEGNEFLLPQDVAEPRGGSAPR